MRVGQLAREDDALGVAAGQRPDRRVEVAGGDLECGHDPLAAAIDPVAVEHLPSRAGLAGVPPDGQVVADARLDREAEPVAVLGDVAEAGVPPVGDARA